MDTQHKFHIVGGDSRLRAEQARLAFAMGHHAEVYSDLAELFDASPEDGIILACDNMVEEGMEILLEQLSDHGIWLPVVAASHSSDVYDAVAAIRGGAFDYLCLPMTPEALGRLVDHAVAEAARHISARRRLVEARQRIGSLSKREREVLDWLSEGCSNKAIARTLSISPRTVEIHRANMMDKLGANHAAEAVRLRLEAELQHEGPRIDTDEEERVAGRGKG
jgi:FixJ family two-component response regulator